VQDYESDGRGQPPYNPLMMTKLILYSYCIGQPSSRKIEKRAYEDIAFRYLAAGNFLDHDTICEFRRRHLDELSRLFVQVLQLCMEAGLVKMGHIALDGTKVKANASKHKAMSYGRMCIKERELEELVRGIFEEAERIDEEEDRKYGKGKRGDELPEELRFHESRLRKIKEAKKALEEKAERKAKEEGKIDDDGNPLPRRGRKPKHPPGRPRPKDQRNFTDPESRIMKHPTCKGGFIQGYNSQAAVEQESQVIVAADVTNESNDKRQIETMVEQMERNLGKIPEELSADAGYYSESNLRYLKRRNIDAYIPPDKMRHRKMDVGPSPGRMPKGLNAADRMRCKLGTEKGRKAYSIRKETVEPVFGQTKEVRGFRQFLLRGLENVQREWKLICIGHNVLKLFRSGYVFRET